MSGINGLSSVKLVEIKKENTNNNAIVQVKPENNSIGVDELLFKKLPSKNTENFKDKPLSLFPDVKLVHDIADNALIRTADFPPPPSEPKVEDFSSPDDYSKANTNYKSSLLDYSERINVDRGNLLEGLKNVSSTTKDPNIKNLVDSTLKTVSTYGYMNKVSNVEDFPAIAKSRQTIIGALSKIRNMTNFMQPKDISNILNRDINKAKDYIFKEKDDIKTKAPKSISNMQKEIDSGDSTEIGGIYEDKKDIEAIKSINPKELEDKLSVVINQNEQNKAEADFSSIKGINSFQDKSANLLDKVIKIKESSLNDSRLINRKYNGGL